MKNIVKQKKNQTWPGERKTWAHESVVPGDVTGLFSKFEQFHAKTPADGHQKERKYEKILNIVLFLIKIDKYNKNCVLTWKMVMS